METCFADGNTREDYDIHEFHISDVHRHIIAMQITFAHKRILIGAFENVALIAVTTTILVSSTSLRR